MSKGESIRSPMAPTVLPLPTALIRRHHRQQRSRAQTFTIYNVGQAALNLGATPAVAISGPQGSDFVVTAQPAATIPPGGSTTLPCGSFPRVMERGSRRNNSAQRQPNQRL